MPNYSGVWTIREQGVAEQAGLWQEYIDLSIRGVFAGGYNEGITNVVNVMDYISINSTGNATDFGDLSSPRANLAGCASTTRGIAGGGLTTGFSTSGQDFIDYITIASTGNGTDFGNLVVGRNDLAACNSATRGIFHTGRTGTGSTGTNHIDYITISSTGNATDFGDNNVSILQAAGTSSSTRGVFGGARNAYDYISYITIASTGDASDFGNLTTGRQLAGALSNGTDYITIASTGNATDFGDVTQARNSLAGVSSSIRGCFGGGISSSVRVNTIDYITIASTGNATDFGDLSVTRDTQCGMSNANGGLQ